MVNLHNGYEGFDRSYQMIRKKLDHNLSPQRTMYGEQTNLIHAHTSYIVGTDSGLIQLNPSSTRLCEAINNLTNNAVIS